MWIFTILVIPVLLVQASVLPKMRDASPILGETTALEQEEIHCQSNMLFDWTENKCVCIGQTVYYSPMDSCFNPFEQGPCKPGHYLAISKDADVPECVVNTCGNNGTLPYKNSCYSLLTTGPCKSPEILQISPNMMELQCSLGYIAVHHLIEAPIQSPEYISCPQGTRRAATGQCRKLI